MVSMLNEVVASVDRLGKLPINLYANLYDRVQSGSNSDVVVFLRGK